MALASSTAWTAASRAALSWSACGVLRLPQLCRRPRRFRSGCRRSPRAAPATARLMSVAALSTASSSVGPGPARTPAARIASTSAVWSAGRAALTRLAAAGDVLVGEGQPLLGRLDVAGHRSQRGCRRIALCSAASVCCAGSTRAVRSTICWVSASSRLGALITRSRSLLERFALRVQFAVGLGRGDDHPGQQVAALLRRLGDGVVEDLADVERLRQRRFRVGRRRG